MEIQRSLNRELETYKWLIDIYMNYVREQRISKFWASLIPLHVLIADDTIGRIIFEEHPSEKPRKDLSHCPALKNSQLTD